LDIPRYSFTNWPQRQLPASRTTNQRVDNGQMPGPNVKMQLGIAEPANPRPPYFLASPRGAYHPNELLSSWPLRHDSSMPPCIHTTHWMRTRPRLAAMSMSSSSSAQQHFAALAFGGVVVVVALVLSSFYRHFS